MIADGGPLFVAGHRGLVGSAVVRALASRGSTADVVVRARQELDLTDGPAVHRFFETVKPRGVILAAAKVGGIEANRRYPAEFITENLLIQTNIITAAHRFDVERLVFLGSSCIYPRLAPQPIPESALLGGPLEPTNEPYAVAKIAGIRMVQAHRRQYGRRWICLMPTNLYGPNDNYHPEGSHLVPGLIRRFHEAKLARAPRTVAWGTGTPRRELMHVDDLADALLVAMERYDEEEVLNVGVGVDHSIAEIVEAVRRAVAYEGTIEWDTTKPDGTPRKLLDVTRLLALGWRPKIALAEGLAGTYAAFVDEVAKGRERTA